LYALAALALGHGTHALAQASPITLFELSTSPSVVERADLNAGRRPPKGMRIGRHADRSQPSWC
jgi:hypothetical protein